MAALMLALRFFILAFLSISYLWPTAVYASRPFLAAESAVPIERGVSRLELGYEYARFSNSNYRQAVLVELTHGLINNLDFEVEVPTLFVKYSGDHQEDLGDLRLKSKVRFLKGREANPLSLSGQMILKFPTCRDNSRTDPVRILNSTCTGEVDVGLLAIASKPFYPVTVHLNLGYTFAGNPPGETLDDVFLYDLAFEYETGLTGLGLVTELMGEFNQNSLLSGQETLAFLFGAIYEVIPNINIDGAFSAGFTEANPDFSLSVGLGYYF
jgi:hypothetical protein